MSGDKFDQLYNALKADGAVTGTREHFRQFVYAPGKQGYNNRKQLYDALHADGAVSSKSYEEFAQRLGLHAVNPKSQQKPVAEKKPITTAQRAQEVAAQYQQTKPLKQPKFQQTKPLAQNKQQPSTATASGTDYMKNWQLMHMSNDQMNPMQQAQASNMRARMQRAQEQAAQQEKRNPIAQSRVDLNPMKEVNRRFRDMAANGALAYSSRAKRKKMYDISNANSRSLYENSPLSENFNEMMQRLDTPKARRARAKQQREDDARTLAKYEVEGNEFARNYGKFGTIAPEIDSLIAPSMKEADDLSWSQYQQALKKAGNDAYLRNKAWKDLQDNRIRNRQNVLADTLSSKLQEIYSQKGLQEHIMQSADKLNMGVEEYVDKYVTPHMMQRAQNILGVKNIEEILPQSATEYVVRRLSDSILGTLSAGQDKSREQIAREQEAMAIADGLEKMPTVNGYKAKEGYKSGMGARFVSTAANMAMDSPILGMTGSASNLTVDLGKQVLMKGLAKAGLVKAGAKLTAQQLAFKAANMTMAQKIASGLVEGTAKSSLNLGGYSSITAALGQASTGDDTSLSALGQAALEGFEHGAITGAMFGVSGAIMAPWVSKFGITGLEKSIGEKWMHGTQKLGATAAGLGVEAGTMMVADNITGDKDISFGTWLEDVVMVGAFKAGEPKNYAHIGNALYNLTHNANPHFVIGKNANGSPIAVDIRLTPDEKNELISSVSGKNLMDAFVDIDAKSKSVRDKKGNLTLDKHIAESLYKDFMADPEVSQSTKEKVNAAMGLFNTTRGKSYRSVNDVKNKQILEYTKNGTLLTRTSYKNADERRAILYKQKAYRDNDELLSLVGMARLKDLQLLDDNGKVKDIAILFLKDKGYDPTKKSSDPSNASLIAQLKNEKSALYADWVKYADRAGIVGEVSSDYSFFDNSLMGGVKDLYGIEDNRHNLFSILAKDPMKRTDRENDAIRLMKLALESNLFPNGKPHEEQAVKQGESVAQDNNLGTEQPNGEAVKAELNGLRQAESEMDELMHDNDVFGQNFQKLKQHGLTNPQIYDWMVQQGGLTVEQLEPFAHYINANARVQGMQEATKNAIDEQVSSYVQDWSFHGTLNGQEMNGEQAIFVQDRDGRMLILGSGEIAFDSTTGRAKEGVGDMIVCLDPATNEMVYLKSDDVTLSQTQDAENFGNEYRQKLQTINSEPYNQAAQEQAMKDAAKPQQEVQPKENKNGEETKRNTNAGINEPQQSAKETTGSDAEAAENNNTKTVQTQQVEQPQPTRKFADGSDVPMTTDSKGRPTPDYEKMTPEQSAEILTDDFGENAEKVMDGQIKKAEKALKDAEKMKVDYTAEPNDIMEQEALKNQTIQAAKKQLDHAQNIKKAMTAKKVAESVRKPTESAEGSNEASSTVAKKFQNAPRMQGNSVSKRLPDGTKLKGHYEIVPAESLTPSHDAMNGYKKTEGFPVDENGRTVNDRDYENDKAAQQVTDQMAQNYSGQAITQVPTVSDEGVVYDGNGRTMAGQKAAKNGTDSEYIEDLLDNAQNYGFTREQIEQSGIEHPRLVMVTDERLPYDTATFSKFNRNEKKTQSNTEQAVAKAKSLTSDEVGAIIAEIEGNGTLDAFFNNSKAINDLVKTLVDKGIIGQNEVAQMMDSPERLSAQGREYVKNLLLGSIFKPETIRMLGIEPTLKNKAINAIRSVMDNMKLGDYSLRDEIDQAIQLLYEARQGGNKVDTLLRTPDMFGEDAAKRYPSISQMMALALEGKVSDFRDLLDEYNCIAAARNTGEGDVFGEAPTKEELVNEFLNFKKWKDYGTRHSENEGSNDVSGTEKPQQEASGGNGSAGEGTEPEQPRVEEPDDLVNKELENRIKVTDEETETPSENGPVTRKKILIDGDKEVIKVDEPNDKGEYTGSYYEYDGKKFGDLNEVVEYVDGKAKEKPLPLLPKEEKPDPKFNPIEAAAAEFKKEHPLTDDEIMNSDLDDLSKDIALDYLNGEVTDDLHRAIYESIYAKIHDNKVGIEPLEESASPASLKDRKEALLKRADSGEVKRKDEAWGMLADAEELVAEYYGVPYDEYGGRERTKSTTVSIVLGYVRRQLDKITDEPVPVASEKQVKFVNALAKGERLWEAGLEGMLPNKRQAGWLIDKMKALGDEYLLKMHPDEIEERDNEIRKGIDLVRKFNGAKPFDWEKEAAKIYSSDPMEGIKNAADGYEKEKISKTEPAKSEVKTADDAAVSASNKKVNDLWKELMNAGKDEASSSFIGLNSRQLEVLPKLVSAMAENAYLRIKRGMHNLEDVVKEMRKEFAPVAKIFKKEDVDAIYEQMMNIRYRDGEQRMSLKDWADYYEKTSPKHQENLVGDSKTAEERKQAEKKFIDVIKLQLSFGRKFNGIVELRKMAERLGLKDIKDTDLQELAETAIVQRARSIAASEATDNAGKFKRILNLYENQPSLNQRDSERVMKQQYSTPAPYAFLADMYVKGNGKEIKSALEPSAGNGMLTIGLPKDAVHVNDIDAQRLANLRRQGFKNVTSQDGTQPFADKDVDVVVTNPPFGSATPKEYDGYKISSLEGQMAINALDSMKDYGRAAIIIGGKTEYAKNGSLNPKDKAFLGYLYSHYNVEDVINVDGSLFAKQGTTFPTRIILINGRRNYDPEHKVFPPVEKDARAETVKDYDELYKRIEDDILRSKEQPVDIRRKEKREGDKPSGRENFSDSTKENGGRGRLGTTTVPDGTSGNSEPSELDVQSRPVEQSEDADGRPVEATGNGDSNTDGGGGQTPLSQSGPADGGSGRGGNESSGGNEPVRNSNGENGRERGVRHGSGHIQQPLEPAKKEEKKQTLTTEKVQYQPHSSAYSIGAVVPARQKEALDNVLNKLGDADQYLVDNLGYNDKEDLYAHLAAEQIDAVALGLKQMEKGNGFIIGDQTGIGKGRQAAAIIRYAVKQGRIPISFTQKANLFSDTYRDLNDIGSPELRPFILASDSQGNIKVNYDEEVKGLDGKTTTVRKQKVVYKIPSKTETERVLKYIAENGKLPEGYDYILTTYSQIRNGLEEFKGGKWKAKKKVTATDRNGQMKRDAIRRIADNSIFILDESHDAAGEGSGSAFIQEVLPKVKGVTFLSATYAKTPDAMKLYALKTDLGSKNKEEGEKGDASWKVLNAIKKGGAVFQEIMSQALTKSGQMIRRERDMTGVTIDWTPLTEDEVEIQAQRDKFDNIFGIFNDILNFQRTYVDAKLGQMSDDLAFIQGSADHTPGTKDMGIGNVTFASKAYNVVQQALFSIKAEKVADYAIESLKNGEKPVIAVNNTMGTMIKEYPMGVEMDMPDLNSTLMKGLEGILRYTEKNEMGDQVNSTLRVEELGEEAVARYNEIKQKIASVSSGLSISPIDVIKHRLEEAGYKVGELTGRDTEMVYNENGKVVQKSRTDKNKNALADRFNNGDLDVLIINRSAAAGISLHASSKFKDQRQRTMIFAQMQGNINDEVQIRGRIDRTGQVRRGKYVYLISAIPAEQRLMMMFKNKLKSLDANTTSSQKSKFNEVDVQDFTNKYGDEIVLQYMAQHPEYYNKLADPLGWGFMEYARDGLSIGELKSGMKTNITSPAYEVMKRLTLLPVKEQEVVLKDISDSYSQKIKQLNDMGMNDLEMTDMPLEAKTLKREVWKKGSDPDGDNAFADNTYIETVEMNVLKKPMKAEEVEAAQKKMLDGKDYETWRKDKVAEIRAAQQAKIEDTKAKMAEQTEKKVAKVEESTRLALERENAKIQKKLDKGEELKPGEHVLTEEEIKTRVDTAVDDVKRRLSKKLSDAIENVNVKYDMFVNPLFAFDPNKTISVPNDWYVEEASTSLYPEFGRIIGFKYDKNYNLGSSSIVIATTDSRKRVEIPLNRPAVFERIQADSERFSKECRVVNMDAWDRMIPKKDRTTGRIITGNMLEALADNSSIGHLISYTTDDGKVKQGILVPDGVSIAEITGNMPIAKAYDWFTKKTSGTELASTDGTLRLTKNFGSMYTLFVPASRKEGGKYYLNQDLLDLVHGHNFQSKGKNFWATFDAEKLKDVLNVLNGMGVEVKTPYDYSESDTHFREDRGFQYSKTDTKDVKNSRIIPEDVDKDVSSQIEKKFDDEIERVYGSNITPEERAEIEKATTIFSRTAYSDEWYKDENKVKHVRKGLSSWHNYYNDLAKQFEEAYGITRKTRITTSKTAENNTRDGFVGMPDLSTSRSRNEEAVSGRGDEIRMPEEDAKYYRKIIESIAAINRAHDYFVERAEKLASKYGVRGDEWIPKEVIEKVFEDYNSDKNIKKLYELVKEQIKNLDVKFADVSGGENGTVGYYDHGWNSIRINFEELCAHGSTNQDLASTILHEMLHPLTSDIIAMYQKGHADKLTPSQIDAAKEAIDIYNELKQMQKDGKLSNHYGLTNPREMITELATPEWRKALSEIPNGKHWWNRIINTVAKLFGVNKFNKLGELTDTLDKLLSNFGKEQFDFASRHQKELFDEENQGKKVTDPEEIKRLEEEPKIKVYRAMQVIDGKLYPPMAASVGGKLVEANELGQWIRADENPDLAIPDIDPKTGKQKVDKKTGELKWKFKLDKGGRDATGKKATDINAAYNPYWHMSRSPLNDQFKSAWIRPNIVVVECETPVSELTSGYKAERAKDAVGEVDWKSGSVSGEVFKQTGRARKVILSRWCKPVRVLDDAEVAQRAKEFVGEAKVEIPENVLTPKQRIAFEEAGFKIGAPEKGVKKSEQIMEALEKGLTIDNTVLSEDGTKFRTNHGDGNYPTSSVENHVEKVAQKTGANVQMVSSVDEITNKAAKAAIEEGRKITGWYDENTGEVHLYMPNIHDRYTAEKTIWHEVVGHKGMRELFGDERFDKFLRDVWYDLDKPENAALKKLVDEERKYNPMNIYDAIEEGIARLAEEGKGEYGFWNNIRNKVTDFLHEIGYRIAPNTKDVKYILWLSKNLQKNPNDPYWKMRAEAVKYRLDHEDIQSVVSHDGVFYENDGKARSLADLPKAEYQEATDGEIHFRTTPTAATALDRYHRSLDAHGYMATESYMDNMLSLKKLMNAIEPDKKIEDIASSENPYILQNTMQGAMSDAAKLFEINIMKPLEKSMAGILDAFDGKNSDEKIRNCNLYMITKHGLERNRVFFVRDAVNRLSMDESTKKDADYIETQWDNEKARLDSELTNGTITLDKYYEQLDEFIRQEVNNDYKAEEHDYSGIHGVQEIKDSDPYDDAAAIKSVMDTESKMESNKQGSVKDYWDKIKTATQYSVDSDYRNSIISKELRDHVSNMFNWYVPLRKYDETTAEDTYGYITEKGDPKSFIGSTIMRARGHKYLSETNILAQIGAMGNRAISNGGQNAIKQAFARFTRSHSGNNLITETSVWYETDPKTGIVYERYPDIPDDATPDEINQIVYDFNKDMKSKESQGLASKVYRRGSIGYKFQRAENRSQHIVDVMIAGKKHSFVINGNPRAAQALNGMLEHKVGTFGKPFSVISIYMAQTCTSYNPEFVMRNMIRDFEFASTNLLAKEGMAYTKTFEKYYAQVGLIEGIRNTKFSDFKKMTGFGLFSKYRNGTLDTSDKIQRYFKEFMENGGETGWVQVKNTKDLTEEYKLHIKTERNKVRKVSKGIFDAVFKNLENINEVAENLARFATYCASRDAGRSAVRSAYDAKEVSTNFNRHGSGSEIKSFANGEMSGFDNARKQAYRFTSAWFRNTSMFFNAGIQSTNLLIKNFKNNKAGTIGYIMAGPMISGMAMALLNNFLIANEDEKDRKGVKDPYGELPDYIRRNNLCIYTGGGEFITIPLAIEERAFYGLGDLAAGLTFSKNISGQKNPALDAVGCISQLAPVTDYLGNASFGKHPVQETAKAVLPSATSPFLEWAFNSDWKGAPIHRENKFDEYQPSWMLAYQGTPEWLINMNKKVNAMTNDVAPGNENMLGNGFLDAVTDPSGLQHFYSGYLGGAATFMERLGGIIRNGKDTETKDIPFVRSLFYTPSEKTSLQRTKSKWYNYLNETEKMIANAKRLKSKNVPLDELVKNYGDYYKFKQSKEAEKMNVIETATKEMNKWKKLRDKSSDTESIKFANQNIDNIMMKAVDELDKLN